MLYIYMGVVVYWCGIIIAHVNNRMEKRTMNNAEKEKSHDLLRTIFHCQEEDNFIKDFKAHRLNEKYRMLEQKLHSTSKSNPFKQSLPLHQRLLRDTHHLVKHQNKVQANIELHRLDKANDNFALKCIKNRSTMPTFSSMHADAYFTPKTRYQILAKHTHKSGNNKIQYKYDKNQSDFSIKLATQSTPAKLQVKRLNNRNDHQGSSHIGKDKQNVLRCNTNSNVEIPSLQSKCNSFSTFTHCPSRLYGKEKQQLVSLDEQITPKSNQISGFTRHQLFSYYKSLISFSKNSTSKYMAGFETMLNLMNITSNETTIRQLLTSFVAKPSFQQFLDVFERIVESSLRQSVVDYFQIVLDGKWSRELCFDQLIQLLSERMSSYHAKEIVEQVYFELEKDNDQKVTVQDIINLCYRSQDFCAFMRGYCQQTQRKRLSQRPRGKPIF